MTDNERWFIENKVLGEYGLRSELIHQMRRIHHALDNYGGNMGADFKEAMESIEKDYEKALEILNRTLHDME